MGVQNQTRSGSITYWKQLLCSQFHAGFIHKGVIKGFQSMGSPINGALVAAGFSLKMPAAFSLRGIVSKLPLILQH
jgi:hypothetical protein